MAFLAVILVLSTWQALNFWGHRPVKVPYIMPIPVPYVGTLFDHCKLSASPEPIAQLNAGTPVPMNPVDVGADWSLKPVAAPEVLGTTSLTPDIDTLKLQIVKRNDFDANHFHVVLIGAGYSEEEIATELPKIIDGLKINFKDIKVDFTYVLQPVDVDFESLSTRITFVHDEDRIKIIDNIRATFPADSIIMAVKTNTIAGSSYNGQNMIVLTANNPAVMYISTHEIGHQLGLGDGYREYFNPNTFPNSELFYLDDMPNYLVLALNELGSMPPLYVAGTCNGRLLYTFYETKNNIMGNYWPEGPNSWGESPFTPLQMQIMNNYIKIRQGR